MWIRSMTRSRSDGSKKNFAVLDLFSGIGGFSLGLEAAGAFRTVAFCEREPFCQAVLRKHWPEVPIYDDVRTIDTDRLGRVDLICGGFPCQPWSVAGQQRGAEDDRDLWPVMASLIEDIRPRWVIGENVRGFVNEPLGLQRSLSDLESLGYQAVPFIIPACAVDAPHRRDRVWIVAHSQPTRTGGASEDVADAAAQRLEVGTGGKVHQQKEQQRFERCGADVADADSTGLKQGHEKMARGSSKQFDGGGFQSRKNVPDANGKGLERRLHHKSPDSKRRQVTGDRQLGEYSDGRSGNGAVFWPTEPDVGRVAHGVSNRVDRLKALGNAVVPQVVEQIGRAILAAEGA